MKIVSSYDQMLLDEGRKEGLQEGLQQGQLKMIELQLETKFGAIEPSLKNRVATLNVNQLENLGVALIRLNNLTDVMLWLDEHKV